MIRRISFLLSLIVMINVAGAEEHASEKHHGHAGMSHAKHMAMMQSAKKESISKPPKEAGQSAFAAISEIVALLVADPATDWSKVSITALRNHLVDMDRLVLGANVEEQSIANGMRFDVTGSDEVLGAIKAMVPAHASMLNQMPEFTAVTTDMDNGVVLTVTGNKNDTVPKIKGLGFFGLMATGSHHQPHHLGMAKGEMVH